jgi:uncharacterized membrane protein
VVVKNNNSNMITSKKGEVSLYDWQQILITAMIVGGSSIITFLIELIPSFNLGEWNTIVVLVLTIIGKYLQKLLETNIYVNGK